MIPKIIHYCWFGGNPYNKTINKCLKTWHEFLPEYQFILWNEDNSPMEHPYIKQAYIDKKYAFVADYVRLWALYNFGGIYLDTDMFIIKKLDESILENNVVFGYETALKDFISAGFIASVPKNNFILEILKKYDTLIFNAKVLSQMKIPLIITQTYEKSQLKKEITLLPYDYFYPYPFEARAEKDFLKYATIHTFAIHLWDKSWYNWKDFLFNKMNSAKKHIAIRTTKIRLFFKPRQK